MIKIDFDIDAIDELEDSIRQSLQPRLNAVMSEMAVDMERQGRDLAARKLDSGLGEWQKGFKVDQVGDGHFIVSVTGKLAEMIEEGAKAGEISDMIMGGNRARVNQAEGKHYVDVPMMKNADFSSNFSGKKVSVASFRDADSLVKHVKFSDKNSAGGIKKAERLVSRVEDVIKSTNPDNGAVGYLEIRRVNESSVWPETSKDGAKILDTLEQNIEATFDRLAAKVFKD